MRRIVLALHGICRSGSAGCARRGPFRRRSRCRTASSRRASRPGTATRSTPDRSRPARSTAATFAPGRARSSSGRSRARRDRAQVDHGRLYVSGATTGKAFVYDARRARCQGVPACAPQRTTFINDVVGDGERRVLHRFESAVIYRVPTDLGPAQTIPLTGDFQLVAGFNLNGIDATRNGHTLLAVQSNTGKLFTISPATGATHAIDLHGATLVERRRHPAPGQDALRRPEPEQPDRRREALEPPVSGTINRTITTPTSTCRRRSPGSATGSTRSTRGSASTSRRRRTTTSSG